MLGTREAPGSRATIVGERGEMFMSSTPPASLDNSSIAPPFAYSEIVPLNKDASRVGAAARQDTAGVLERERRAGQPRGIQPGCAQLSNRGRERRSGQVVHGFYFAWAGSPEQSVPNARPYLGPIRACLPAYVRRYPFCMAKITSMGNYATIAWYASSKAPLATRVIGCSTMPAHRLPIGSASKSFWSTTRRTCCARTRCGHCRIGFAGALYHAGETRSGTAAFAHRHGAGMRAKLTELGVGKMRDLMSRAYLARIYLHIASLENFQRLLERRASFAARPAILPQPPPSA
jgi:hypothetical protein